MPSEELQSSFITEPHGNFPTKATHYPIMIVLLTNSFPLETEAMLSHYHLIWTNGQQPVEAERFG